MGQLGGIPSSHKFFSWSSRSESLGRPKKTQKNTVSPLHLQNDAFKVKKGEELSVVTGVRLSSTPSVIRTFIEIRIFLSCTKSSVYLIISSRAVYEKSKEDKSWANRKVLNRVYTERIRKLIKMIRKKIFDIATYLIQKLKALLDGTISIDCSDQL